MSHTDTSQPTGTTTPNVVINNPNIRHGITVALGVVGIVLGTVVAVDSAAPAFDLTPYTVPAFVGYSYLAAAFGLAVTAPNTPRS